MSKILKLLAGQVDCSMHDHLLNLFGDMSP